MLEDLERQRKEKEDEEKRQEVKELASSHLVTLLTCPRILSIYLRVIS
jgi:hypothetical protein